MCPPNAKALRLIWVKGDWRRGDCPCLVLFGVFKANPDSEGILLFVAKLE